MVSALFKTCHVTLSALYVLGELPMMLFFSYVDFYILHYMGLRYPLSNCQIFEKYKNKMQIQIHYIISIFSE